MTSNFDVAMLGLPGAGKTTYLAALYAALDSPSPGMPGLARQPITRAYLEEIRDAWLAGRPVDRTAVGTGEIVELEIELGDAQALLRIPDVSGESFTEALVSRSVDASLAQVVRDSSGLMLFTHPGHLEHRVPIVQAIEAGFVAASRQLAEPQAFDPVVTTPTETRLVDLLQWATRLDRNRAVLRVAVLLSAWDTLPDMKPRHWLAQMPLLKSYLENTEDHIEAQVFGVSAQGGVYGSADDPVGTSPADRPYIVLDDGDRHNDISLPLRWAFER